MYTATTKYLSPLNCMYKKFKENTLSKSGASKGQFLKDGYRFWLNTKCKPWSRATLLKTNFESTVLKQLYKIKNFKKYKFIFLFWFCLVFEILFLTRAGLWSVLRLTIPVTEII